LQFLTQKNKTPPNLNQHPQHKGNKGVSMYSSSPADCNSALAVTSMTDYDGKPGGVGTPEGATNADDTFTDFSNFAAPFSAGRVVAAPGALGGGRLIYF
jgi:hypothetical protein